MGDIGSVGVETDVFDPAAVLGEKLCQKRHGTSWWKAGDPDLHEADLDVQERRGESGIGKRRHGRCSRLDLCTARLGRSAVVRVRLGRSTVVRFRLVFGVTGHLVVRMSMKRRWSGGMNRF